MKTLLLALSAAASLAVAAPALAHDYEAGGYGRGDYGYSHDGYGVSRGDEGRDHRRGFDDRWSWRVGRWFGQQSRYQRHDRERGDYAERRNTDRGWDRYQFRLYRGGYGGH
jgi:opacity protein-like surface antigen